MSGVAFLMETKTRDLVGISDKNAEIFYFDANGQVQRVNAASSTNPIVRQASSVSSDKQTQDVFFTSAQGRIFATSQQLSYNGIQWTLVICIVSTDFTKDAIVYGSVSGIIAVAFVLLTIPISIIVSRLALRGINSLKQKIEKVQDMQLDDIIMSFSGLSPLGEVRHMEIGFLQMLQTLKEYRAFLPEHVLNPDAVSESREDIISATSTASIPRPFSKVKIQVNPVNDLGSELSRSASFKRFDLGLSTRKVTILSIKFTNFNYLLPECSQDVVDVHGELISVISKIIKSRGGNTEHFKIDGLLATFNTIRMCREHSSAACIAALDIIQAIDELNSNSRKRKMPEVEVSISVSSGNCFVGNLGNSTTRTYCVVGDPLDRCEQLHYLNQYFGTVILADEQCSKFARKVNMKPITSFIVNNTSYDVFEVYNMIRTASESEWMYTMVEEKEADLWVSIQQAFEMTKNGEYEQSLPLMKQFLDQYPEDEQVLRMMGRVMARKKSVLYWSGPSVDDKEE